MKEVVKSNLFLNLKIVDILVNPIKEKLPFDLKDIPKKRQGVNINTIMNLK